jgi:hypothetical protein
METITAFDDLYYFKIEVYYKQRSILDKTLFWNGLNVNLFSKYRWYFEYRAALEKVNHPKGFVEIFWGTYTPETPDDILKSLKNKIKAKKAKITEYTNKIAAFIIRLEDYKKDYNEIFPIEHDEAYKNGLLSLKNAELKVERLKVELTEMQSKLI